MPFWWGAALSDCNRHLVGDSLSRLLNFQMEKATVFSHEAHHGGLWTKLLENARKWTTIQPYFVADVVEGCLPTVKFSKVCVPAAFLEKYKNKLTESVILEGPDGQKWPVMLGLSLESKPCLLHGWREFAADYKLVVGDHIVFFMCDNSHFLVQVFDAHRNIKRRGDELNTEAVKKGDSESESVELTNTQASGGDEEENPTESKLLGRSSAPDPASAVSSDAEEEVLRLKRSRKLNRKSTENREGDELYTGSSERLEGLFKLAQDMKETAALHGGITAEGKPEPETAPVTASMKPKLATTVAEDKKPLLKRSSKLPTEVLAGKGVHNKKRQAKGMKSTPVDDQEALPEEMLAPETQAKARNKAKVSRDRGKEPAAEACPPLSPRPVEAAKPAFKRPKPRILPASSHKLMYVSKRRPVTTQEREAALASAQEYARKSINKNFVMQLRTTQVYCGFHLAVPSGFAEAMLLPPVRTKVTLFDVTGKTWEVEWMGDRPPRQGVDSAGWTRFALEHCLEEGDVCVFELPDPKVFNISVEIFTVVPLLEVTEQGWRSHYIVPADDPKPQESQPKRPQALVFPGSDKETTTMATQSLHQEESVIS